MEGRRKRERPKIMWLVAIESDKRSADVCVDDMGDFVK